MTLKLKIGFLAGLLGVLLLSAGCRPEGVIPPDGMESLLADLYLTDACIETTNAAGSDVRTNLDSLHVYLPVLEKHGYTDTMFQQSLDYYLHRPKDFVKIFKNVRIRLEKEADQPIDLLDAEEQGTEETLEVVEGAEPAIEREPGPIVKGKPKEVEPTEKPVEKPAPVTTEEVKPVQEEAPVPEPKTTKKSNRKRMTQNDLKRLEEELKKK